MMKEHYKAVFLPADERLLTLYKGYVLNGIMQPQLKKEDIIQNIEYYSIDDNKSKAEQIFRFVIIIPLIPLLFIAAVIATIFKRFDQFTKKSGKAIDKFFSLFFKKREIKKIRTEKIKRYEDVVEEDVLDFLTHCKKHFAKVFIYSYGPLSEEDDSNLSKLIQLGLINSFVRISKLSDLQSLVLSESVSLHNSFFVIKDSSEVSELKKLGITDSYGLVKHIELWKKRRSKEEGGNSELEWNSAETLVQMKRNVVYYLEAREKLFFTTELIIFIEDELDIILNKYISENLHSINIKLKEKNFQLLYFPAIKNADTFPFPGIFEFLRYRNPILYSLSDSEIESSFSLLIKHLSANQFYSLLIEELGLPYFKKPALLRNIAGGMPETENRFTYQAIEYSSVGDLDLFFDTYIDQLKVPNDYEHIFFSLSDSQSEYNAGYNAENCFDKESKADTDELKLKIDSIKAEGKYGVLAEALMYMLAAIKDEQPELISKVKPLIEKRKLLESKVVLSSIYIDNHKRIFLPQFGNVEVKMHALPKTVYLFYLQHPEGVRIKELYQFKKELLEIYNTLTNKDENEEIHRAINDLVDMKKPNINMQCSRIRAAFRSIMDEHIAKYYYIDGQNGEPKKIALPKNLIDIRY